MSLRFGDSLGFKILPLTSWSIIRESPLMGIKTAETANSDSGLVAQFEFEFLPSFLASPLPSSASLSLSFNAMRTLCTLRETDGGRVVNVMFSSLRSSGAEFVGDGNQVFHRGRRSRKPRTSPMARTFGIRGAG